MLFSSLVAFLMLKSNNPDEAAGDAVFTWILMAVSHQAVTGEPALHCCFCAQYLLLD